MAPVAEIKELKEKAQHSLRAARKIQDDREKAGQPLTSEDHQKIRGYMDEIDTYKVEWTNLERMAGFDNDLASQMDSTDVDDDDPTVVRHTRGQRLPQGGGQTEPAEDGWTMPEGDKFDGSLGATFERSAQRAATSVEYNHAFYAYMRQRGMTPVMRQHLNQVRTMVEGVDADGGFLAPTQLVAGIQYEVQQYEQLKPRMTNINTNARSLTFTKGLDSIVMGWVAELGTKPEDQVSFGRSVMVPHVGAVVVWISDELLEDEQFGLQGYISQRVAEAKVLLEEEAFISGSGSGRPWGLLTRLNALSGTPQRFETDGAAITGNDLINLVYSMAPQYRRNGTFILGTKAIRDIRLLKDGNDQYLWQPGLQAGEPQTVLGYPVVEATSTALNGNIATGADVGIFGDLKKYLVMNRINLQVKRLEELRALTDEVGFRFRFRTGGDVLLNQAFKTIRIGS